MMHITKLIALVLVLLASHSRADVIEFTNAQAWQDATGGQYSTIDFTGFADGTPISNQYHALGVNFLPPVFIFASAGMLNDNWGLHGPVGARFTFDTPQNWVAVDYGGAVQFQLLNNGVITYTSTFFQPGGFGHFAGLVSSASFDEVFVFRPFPFGGVFIDDLHWGAAVPAPGALALLAIALIRGRRKRA